MRTSLAKRIVFALIGAVVGALLGLVAACFAGELLRRPPSYESVAWFSGLFFGLIGLLRAAEARFPAAAALRLLWAFAQAQWGRPHASERTEQVDQPPAWRSVGLLLAWFAGVVLLALRT